MLQWPPILAKVQPHLRVQIQFHGAPLSWGSLLGAIRLHGLVACSLPLQFPTKDTSLVSLVLDEQPLVMELPVVSPASCKLLSVIPFLAAKKNSAEDIHTELCQVYGEGCMSSGMVRRWVREFKNGRTDVHDEPRA
ncbi:hypothetical protein LAZ67_17002473 [Cordylochernes scorpioides]|uniref:Mos1 transposase HTH domain-containing protein n=1 Tax=Cordylochernes scorpioides TaxID=51811 RepID=A0ABY6LI66_9ARAC|nr:hypothetical protein LAZ67_17002473 [Cordylochernes scorpioides]